MLAIEWHVSGGARVLGSMQRVGAEMRARQGALGLAGIVLMIYGDASAQMCDPQIAARQAAAAVGNLGSLYQIDAQYQACLRRQQQRPVYVPKPPRQQQQTNWPVRIAHEFDALQRLLIRGQPLQQDIPLSAGTEKMQNVSAPAPAAPQNYVDPFQQRTLSAPAPSVSSANRCGTNQRMVTKGSFTYCEMYMEKPPGQ